MNNTSNPHILSIDLGTSSVRCQVYDSSGNVVSSIQHQEMYQMDYSADGGATRNYEGIRDIVFTCIDRVGEQITAKNLRIDAVIMDTFWHNVVGMNDEDTATTPVISWNDTRPESCLSDLAKEIDPERFSQRTGCPFHASFLPAKLRWLKENLPEAFAKTRFWMSVGEALFFSLLGKRACSVSMASASGLLYSSLCKWDQEILEILSIQEDQLSPIQNPAQGMQGLKSNYASRWPFLEEALWYPALGDGACSNVGAGCTTSDRVTLMVGTSGAMRVGWEGEYQSPPSGLWCYRIDEKRPIQGGALSNGGNVFAWMQQTLASLDQNEIEQELLRRTPDGHGLTFLPFFSGQRSPRWNPNSRATLHGMTISTSPIDIVQAGLESVAYRFSFIHNLLQPHLSDGHVLIASGGGLLQSRAWTTIMANVLGRPVYPSKVKEASCRGGALMALETMGVIDNVSQSDALLDDPINPDMDAHQLYKNGIERHLQLEEHLYNQSMNTMISDNPKRL